jgi:hypothetical protein
VVLLDAATVVWLVLEMALITTTRTKSVASVVDMGIALNIAIAWWPMQLVILHGGIFLLGINLVGSRHKRTSTLVMDLN